MIDIIGRVIEFETRVYPERGDLYARLAEHGQSPKALIVSCSDSRVVPEHVVQAEPGELFTCRNAGNIVPPFMEVNGGVSATVEYAVAVLGVSDVIVCGHSDCGAMKAVANPAGLDALPSVAAWLGHAATARRVVGEAYPELDGGDRVRAISLENVVAQLAHLRTHPSVAARIATGSLTLHGWFVDIHAGQVLGLDGESGRFVPLREGTLPVAQKAERRLAAAQPLAVAAE
ncbi:carbonic anhydrase [Sphingomonas sp.]|uniref:carbonic anhydrase n=1 Tax=Sphingomonas sp. TaxID=28214 RepID=UPI003B00138C